MLGITQQDDVDRLVQLLDELRITNDQGKRDQLEREALGLVAVYLHRSLKPMVTKIFGAKGCRDNADGSLRFTEVLNDFFVKVLEKRDDTFWNLHTPKALRKWVSTALFNQIRDHFRRKKRGQEILAEVGIILEQRQPHFQGSFGLDLNEDVLDRVAQWRSSNDSERRLMAAVLTHRYIEGMPYDQIVSDLDLISKKEAYRLRDKAKSLLKQEFSTRASQV